jgi:hypothetical protein
MNTSCPDISRAAATAGSITRTRTGGTRSARHENSYFILRIQSASIWRGFSIKGIHATTDPRGVRNSCVIASPDKSSNISLVRLRRFSGSGRLAPNCRPPAAKKRESRRTLVSAKSPGVAGTNAPTRQRFRIFGSKEESTDSGHFFCFRLSSDRIANSDPRRERGGLWVYGCLRRYGELVAAQDEARPEGE